MNKAFERTRIAAFIGAELWDEVYLAVPEGVHMALDVIAQWSDEIHQKMSSMDFSGGGETPGGECWDDVVIRLARERLTEYEENQ